MNVQTLSPFLDSLETKGILNADANKKIQSFLNKKDKSVGKLFLTLAGTIGALFASAGVFAIISHNWDDFPKHVRGALSFVPTLVALYVYYIALFKHKESTSWIEASSLFLMLMIGASIALVSQTYQMDGDFDKFVTVWLTCTIPLFFIARASGIAFFYLLLSFKFLTPNFIPGFIVPSGYNLSEKYYLFWVFLVPLLLHFYLTLNRKSTIQGFRSIYLGWIIAIALVLALPLAVKAGYIWWGLSVLLAYYLVGKKYFRHNLSVLARPFQTVAFFHLFFNLLFFSNDTIFQEGFRIDNLDLMSTWTTEQIFFFYTGFILLAGLTTIAIISRKRGMPLNRYVIFVPFLFVLMYLVHFLKNYDDFDLTWLSSLLLNFYVIGFGVNAMIQGSKSGSILYMIYGLFVICFLLWMRYFDMDISFWLKGILFIGVGFMFFLIHYLSKDPLEE